MDLLKWASLCTALVLVASCGEKTVTETLLLETDTFISSDDPSSHAELDYLQLSKTATREDRVILKLPTSKEKAEDLTAEMLVSRTIGVFFLNPLVIAELLTCSSADIISADNLRSSELVFSVKDAPTGTVAGQVELSLLAKGWWQPVNWTTTHPFSVDGKWTTEGGDIDASQTPASVQVSGSELKFNVTEYFRAVIRAGGGAQHFGFIMHGLSNAVGAVKMHSTQSGNLSSRPKLVSVYTGSCLGKGLSTIQSTYILGDEPKKVYSRVE